jgi:predicted transcriptional regulator
MSEKHAFVIMIQEKWWNEFCHQHHQGRKTHAYVQRGAAPPKDTSLILFYVTKPVGEIAGYAEFIERRVGDAEKLWKEHGSESVLSSKEKYDDFIEGAQRVSFIRFKNLHEAARRMPLNELLMFLGVKRLSRKGFYLNEETEAQLLNLMG